MRLIIFIHGFLGHPKGTWRGIDGFDNTEEFWRRSDMIFMRYDSFSESIKGVSDRLRRKLPDYYPRPSPELATGMREPPRDEVEHSYSELILVGHSLGALIARKAILDTVAAWVYGTGSSRQHRPSLLDARLRLFSPASGGYRPAGSMTILDTIESGLGVMRFSAAYQDIQEDSYFLRSTRASTEKLSVEAEEASLRARTLWANPENVVNTIDYDSDIYSQSADDQSHRSVCKPTQDYKLPWVFISNGEI